MTKTDLAKKVARAKVVVALIDKLTDERKKLYGELDELVVELAPVPALEVEGLRLVDAFAKGNTQWGHGPVRRFSIEVIPPPAELPLPAPAKSCEGTRKRKTSQKTS